MLRKRGPRLCARAVKCSLPVFAHVQILYASIIGLFALRVSRLFDHVINIDTFRISTSYLHHLQLIISSYGIYRIKRSHYTIVKLSCFTAVLL